MTRRISRRPIHDLSNAGLVAYNAGKRMYQAGMDWAPDIVDGGPALDPWLSPDEIEARQRLLPSTFINNWRHGWDDAAADDLGSRKGDIGG